MNEREKKLREDFLKCLRSNPCGDVVDDLIAVLKKDYVLVVKENRSCRHCFNWSDTNIFCAAGYCVKHDNVIVDASVALNCDDYLSGSEKAKESIAVLRNGLTGDLIYD